MLEQSKIATLEDLFSKATNVYYKTKSEPTDVIYSEYILKIIYETCM